MSSRLQVGGLALLINSIRIPANIMFGIVLGVNW